jgi:hypothetical protein
MNTLAIISPYIVLHKPINGWILKKIFFVLQNNQSELWKKQNHQASNVTFLEHKWGPNTTDEIQKAHWEELAKELPTFSRVAVYVPDDNPEEIVNWLDIQ